ncbi:Uncharacterised protein [Vibrio cholerae]|nr:Uncharacterised protein [Vibrio cholerae]
MIYCVAACWSRESGNQRQYAPRLECQVAIGFGTVDQTATYPWHALRHDENHGINDSAVSIQNERNFCH